MLDRAAFYLNYDLDANTFKYGRCKGFPGHFQGFGGIVAAASTTINAVVPGAAPFAPLRVGDYIVIQVSETSRVRRRVATKPSNDQITVSGAGLTFSTAAWWFIPFDIGTGANDGALPVQGSMRAWVEFEWTLADSIDLQLEARPHPASAWAPIWTGTYAAGAANPGPVEITELVGSVRLGVKSTAGFAGTDDISIYLCRKAEA